MEQLELSFLGSPSVMIGAYRIPCIVHEFIPGSLPVIIDCFEVELLQGLHQWKRGERLTTHVGNIVWNN